MDAPVKAPRYLTEAQVKEIARKKLGPGAIVASQRLIMPDDSIMMIFEIGVTGDKFSWTVLGRGNSWYEALMQATSPGTRTRPAFGGPSRGGLDIDSDGEKR